MTTFKNARRAKSDPEYLDQIRKELFDSPLVPMAEDEILNFNSKAHARWARLMRKATPDNNFLDIFDKLSKFTMPTTLRRTQIYREQESLMYYYIPCNVLESKGIAIDSAYGKKVLAKLEQIRLSKKYGAFSNYGLTAFHTFLLNNL